MTRASPGAMLAALSGQKAIVVIRRPFVQWLGCDAAARLLDQCMYEADQSGGEPFAVTDTEWMGRLLLSRQKVAEARKLLIGHDLLTIERIGVPARLVYTMDLEAVSDAFRDWLGLQQDAPNGTTGDAKRNNRRRQTEQHSISSKDVEVDGSNIPRVATATADAGAALDAGGTLSAPGELGQATAAHVNGMAKLDDDAPKPERPGKGSAGRVPKAKRESKPLTDVELSLRDAILTACGWGWDVLATPNRVNVTALARKLAAGGRTVADVQTGAAHYARNDWRGRKGQRAGVADLETAIGSATVAPDPSTMSDALRAGLAELARAAARPAVGHDPVLGW